jgi:peptidyl-lysine (3S)-dioxygenase / protease
MEQLGEDTKDFWVQSSVPTLKRPTALEFMREAVAPYHPALIQSAVDHWPARQKWSLEYLAERCVGQYPVNVTPNGLADCVTDHGDGEYFYYPAEVTMSMKAFAAMIADPQSDDAVPYLSQQNNNLPTHFPELLEDIEPSLPLGEEAFGAPPEAVNLWIGDERSVSSLHKDHFENLYVVLSGEKLFTLFPPTDIAFLGETIYPTKTYRHTRPGAGEGAGEGEGAGGGHSEAVVRPKKTDLSRTSNDCPSAELPWIAIDPESATALQTLPSLGCASPLRVRVRAGEALYLPSMWYHRVTQSGPTIAVNYWYPQAFNFRYVFYQLTRRALLPPPPLPPPPVPSSAESRQEETAATVPEMVCGREEGIDELMKE